MKRSVVVSALAVGLLQACTTDKSAAINDAAQTSPADSALQTQMYPAGGYGVQLFANAPEAVLHAPEGWEVRWPHPAAVQLRATRVDRQTEAAGAWILFKVRDADGIALSWVAVDTAARKVGPHSPADSLVEDDVRLVSVSPNGQYLLIESGETDLHTWHVYDTNGVLRFTCQQYSSNQEAKGGLPAGWQPDGSLIYYDFPDTTPSDLPKPTTEGEQYVGMYQWKDGKSTFTGKYFLVFVS